MSAARLLLPALRFPVDRGAALRLAQRGVAGFCVFWPDETLQVLLGELQAAAPHPLLIAADLENGAGQHLPGATRHPPAAALDPASARAAGMLTAWEGRARGVTMVFAPVCDVCSDPRNPIINLRAFADPARAAPEFVAGAHAGGLRACAKHFPGHGATTVDSHVALPVADASREVWHDRDAPAFAACFKGGVDAVMSAHVAWPALTRDPTLPATLSRRVMTDLLRGDLGFQGLAVSDALLMESVLGGRSEGEAARAAIEAGCDLVIGPRDTAGVLDALENVPAKRLEEACARIESAATPLARADISPIPLRVRLRGAAGASIESWGEWPLAPGAHPLRICDLHGDGRRFQEGLSVAHEVVAPDGNVLARGGERGLGAPALLMARADRAWGAGLEPPPAVAALLGQSAFLIALGPRSLVPPGAHLRGWIRAPGEDPYTLEAVSRQAFPR